MKNIKAVAVGLVFAGTMMLMGCDKIQGSLLPAQEEVYADGAVYMACAGTVDIGHTDYGYTVHLTDRNWNDDKSAFRDEEIYLTKVQKVTVVPMDTTDKSLCNTGHFPTVPPADTA